MDIHGFPCLHCGFARIIQVSNFDVAANPKAICEIIIRIGGKFPYSAIMMKELDQIDRDIIAVLHLDGRATLADIGRQVGLSGPAVGERMRRLADDGVIGGYTVTVNPLAFGYTMEAIVRIKPRSRQMHLVEKMIHDEPRFTSCDRVTGEDCFVARLALVNVAELDDILLPLHERAETHTSIVKSSPLRARIPDLAPSRSRAR
jgi:Lrp/AsnC family leucine-responsive transcriptional regulator